MKNIITISREFGSGGRTIAKEAFIHADMEKKRFTGRGAVCRPDCRACKGFIGVDVSQSE